MTANYVPAPALADEPAQPLVRRASLVVTEDKPLPQFRPVGLLGADTLAEIRDTAKSEKKQPEGVVGGQ